MNPKNTFFLVLLAASLFAFIYFYEQHRNLAPPPPAKLLSGFKADEVTNIEIRLRGQDAIRVERGTNGLWQMTKPLPTVYPALSLAVDNLLKALQELLPQNHISAQELKGSHNINADYGFETPQVTITVQQGNEQRSLMLGNPTTPGDQVYAKVVGSEGVDIIGTSLWQFIPRQPSDWRDTVFVNFQGLIFDHITVSNGTKSFQLQNGGTNNLWFMSPHDRVDILKIARLFIKLQALRVNRFQTDDPKSDMEPFGLQPPRLELDFDRGTNHLLTLQFGKSPTNEPSLVYARRDDQSAVVLVSDALVDGWRAEKINFRDRTLAGMYGWVPDEIDVSGSNNFTVRRITNDAWRVTAPFDFPADTNLMKNFLTTLARLEVVPTNGPVAVKDIVPPSEWTNYGLAPPNWKYFLKQKTTNSPSAATNVVMAELDFGATTTNDTVFARRPEEPSVYAVALTNFQKLPGSGIQLRERRIWDFTEEQVVHIIIRQDGKPMELMHKGPNDWIVSAGSQGIINPLAIEQGASELGLLAAEKFVERGEQKRTDYGFTQKSLQISVVGGKTGKAETVTVEFGGWSPRGLRYGMVELDGQKWIFEFPAIVHDRLMLYFDIHENAAAAVPAGAPDVKGGTNAPVK